MPFLFRCGFFSFNSPSTSIDTMLLPGLLLSVPFSGTLVVRAIFLLGLPLPALGSASTVTLMRHGLASPALPVSKTIDLLGEEYATLVERCVRGLTLECRVERVASGEDGSVSGSGDVEREDADDMAAMSGRYAQSLVQPTVYALHRNIVTCNMRVAKYMYTWILTRPCASVVCRVRLLLWQRRIRIRHLDLAHVNIRNRHNKSRVSVARVTIDTPPERASLHRWRQWKRSWHLTSSLYIATWLPDTG